MRAFEAFLNFSVLVAVLGCGNQPAPSGAESPAPPAPTADAPMRNAPGTEVSRIAAPDQQTLAVRDRIQSHYFTTSVQLADGVSLSRGRAELEIQYDSAQPRVALKLQAGNPTDTWFAVLSLEESAILNDRIDAQIGGATLIRHVRGEQVVSESTHTRLTLDRTKDSGRRARFHGRMLDETGATTAEFDTELTISCLVPPELLGVASNGHADSPSPGSGLLINDEDLRSSYCAKFSSLL